MQEGRGKRFNFLLIFCTLSHALFSQDIKVNGGFIEDSLFIGEDINYFVSATYPSHLEMVFPDSNFNFAPFEYADKSYFPTTILDGAAYDSTIYTIQSYEIDVVQYLQLPTTILDGNDSIIVQTPIDSIYLKELAPIVSDTTKLIANTSYSTVDRAFNYPLLYIISGALLLLAVIFLLIFGKQITRYFRLRRLRKEYESFSHKLGEFIQDLKARPDPDTAEYALATWKRYQEKLDHFPFTKLTTKEILRKDLNKELEQPLKSIDQLIYGNRMIETIYQDFQQIEDFTQHRYNKKVEEIKHGK